LNYQLRTIASLTIASLYEKLCASDAHIIDLEAQIQTLEPVGRAHHRALQPGGDAAAPIIQSRQIEKFKIAAKLE